MQCFPKRTEVYRRTSGYFTVGTLDKLNISWLGNNKNQCINKRTFQCQRYYNRGEINLSPVSYVKLIILLVKQ